MLANTDGHLDHYFHDCDSIMMNNSIIYLLIDKMSTIVIHAISMYQTQLHQTDHKICIL